MCGDVNSAVLMAGHPSRRVRCIVNHYSMRRSKCERRVSAPFRKLLKSPYVRLVFRPASRASVAQQIRQTDDTEVKPINACDRRVGCDFDERHTTQRGNEVNAKRRDADLYDRLL